MNPSSLSYEDWLTGIRKARGYGVAQSPLETTAIMVANGKLTLEDAVVYLSKWLGEGSKL